MNAADIRPLTERDAAAWWNLRLEALESEPLAFGKAAHEHRATPVAVIEQRFRETSADYVTLGAFSGGNLVGIVTYVRDGGFKERHKAHVFGMYVSPASRRQGIARVMLAAVLAHAKDDPTVEQLLISVTSTQAAAKALYREIGFTTYGLEPRALRVDKTYVDEEHLILFLR